MSELHDKAHQLHELGEDICRLAASLAAATSRWLVMIAEFDRREGWGGFGIKSCAHWLSWRCGLSPGAAREHVRVARALLQLPLIAAAFAAGTLSYSKVRAVTRIADQDTEQDLLDVALSGTASQVERVVRGWRRAESANAVDQDARRDLRWHWDREGMLIVRARLGPEEGALFLTGLQAAGESEQRSPEAKPADKATEPADMAAEPPDVAAGAADVAAGPPGLAAAAMADAVADDVADDVAAPVIVASPDAAFPRERPSEPAADALVSLAQRYLEPDRDKRGPADRHQVVVHVDAAVLADDTAAGAAYLENGAALSHSQVRRIACDAALIVLLRDGADVLDAGRKRTIPTRLLRAVWARDGGCRFPACTERRRDRVQAHHIWHWADGGPTSLSNLVLLCRFHHHVVHDEGFGVRRGPDGQLRFSAPNGVAVPEHPSWLGADETPAPTAVAAESLAQWDGQPLDLHYAVSVLLSRRTYVREHRDAEAAA